MRIINGLVFTNGTSFERSDIHIAEERIVSVGENSFCNASDDMIDATDCYVVSGFTDIHFHGCFGYDFSDCDLNGLQRMGSYELQSGITQICPASMTYPEDKLHRIIACALQYRAHSDTHIAHSCGQEAVLYGADLVGINLEGPFISPSKRGAQNPDYIIPADVDMFYRLKALAPDLLKLITIAPEIEGALDFIKQTHHDITISLGHTTADYATAMTAFELGARHVTHLFNAMSPFSHRESGVVGAAFDAKHNHVELICDGLHVSDSMIRACFQLFTDERMILVSDSMMATGMSDGAYTLGGQAVTVKGNLATLHNGTIAGSVTNLMNCFRHAVSIGIPLTSALKAVTINPAKAIGIEHDYGSIADGKIANLLLLDRNLNVKEIIFHGKRLF